VVESDAYAKVVGKAMIVTWQWSAAKLLHNPNAGGVHAAHLDGVHITNPRTPQHDWDDWGILASAMGFS
jgi:hypothetical protein